MIIMLANLIGIFIKIQIDVNKTLKQELPYNQSSLSVEQSVKIATGFITTQTDYADCLSYTGTNILEKASLVSYEPKEYNNKDSYIQFINSLSDKINGIYIKKTENGYVSEVIPVNKLKIENEIEQIYQSGKSVQICVQNNVVVGFLLTDTITGETFFDWRYTTPAYSNGITFIENTNQKYPYGATPQDICNNIQDILVQDNPLLYILNIAGINITDSYMFCNADYRDIVMANILSFLPANEPFIKYKNNNWDIKEWSIPATDNPYQFCFDKDTNQLIAVYFEAHNNETDKNCVIKVIGEKIYIDNSEERNLSWEEVDKEFILNKISSTSRFNNENKNNSELEINVEEQSAE